ncbi:hypothetical protein EYF80_044497 [Liparis tanakae]|uniref:Uncharacterized protein n=1 Tax=Liparis tanakae TaxID=230148 RepID=A0A4Z2FYB0_9TELE|nr:hypothetical protein EYF80_044497 [Liparis tanakae]
MVWRSRETCGSGSTDDVTGTRQTVKDRKPPPAFLLQLKELLAGMLRVFCGGTAVFLSQCEGLVGVCGSQDLKRRGPCPRPDPEYFLMCSFTKGSPFP